MDIEKIEALISEFPQAEFAGGVTNGRIDEASARIGLPITGGYRDFLLRFGCGAVESEQFIGLGGPKHLDLIHITEFVRNRKGPSRFPRHLIPVLADGYGNYECLDTRRETAPNEPPVVYWLHDGGDDQTCEEIGATYLDWLADTLTKLREEIFG